MKIVDLRPMIVRRFTRSDQSSPKVGFLGHLSGFVSDFIIKRRLAQRPVAKGCPLLVSVGNLALGGTGKTPVVMAVARDLAAAGMRGAVLTRGYGSPLKGPLVVQPDNLQAGDEARMMAGRLEEYGWSVVQSRNRPQGLKFLENQHPGLNVVLLEDAFQTDGLPRHIDLVILDSWRVQQENHRLQPITGSVFPFGPWRESARGADRATALLVEGKDRLPDTSLCDQPVFSFRRGVYLRQVQDAQEGHAPKNWALVSGIARPEKFETAAVDLLTEPVVLSIRCRDHEKYSRRLLRSVLATMDETGSEGLVTTAKDWVKLSRLWQDPRPVMVLEMELEWTKKDTFNHWLVERVRNLERNQSELTAP